MLTWDAPTERYFQHGVDRGVIYLTDPVVWNGLVSVDEMGGGSSEIIYRDGKIVMADVDASDFEATIQAFFFPDELSECLGIPQVTEGLYADNQKPKRFGLSYRTLVGSGQTDDIFGYQIHLIYNCLASIGHRTHKTLSDTPEPMTFDFSIVCTPVKMTGYRPTAHYILDTRGMGSGQITELEELLYGVGLTAGRLPTPTELFEMMNFGLIMYVHDNGDDTVKISGANQYITENPDGSYTVTNINAIEHDAVEDIYDWGTAASSTGDIYDGGTAASASGDIYDGGSPDTADDDDSGSYTISDGANTVIVL